MVVHLPEGEPDLLVLSQISGELLLLPGSPGQWKSGGDEHIRLRQPGILELHSHGGQGQEIEISILRLPALELLVALADEI